MSWQNATTHHPLAPRSLAARPRWSSAVVRAAAPERWFEALERRSHLSVSSDLADDVLGLQGDSASVLDLEHTPADTTPAPAPPALGASGASEENETSVDHEMPGLPGLPPFNQGMPIGDPEIPAGAAPTRSRADIRFNLRPGNGFIGPTVQPEAVGNPGDFGYDAKAIARWDVVPFQTFTGRFEIGVVAFHINGIDRVDFAVNGGDWTSVRHMTFNRQTNVNEYTITLNAADFADGLIEVRAVAWPTVGEPRVLAGALTGTTESARGEHSMFLNANANGTLPSAVRYVSPTGSDSNDGLTPQTPLATTARAANRITAAQGNSDGGIIYLLPGAHTLSGSSWGNESQTVNRWMTVKPAPGLTKADVTITGTAFSGFNSKLVKFEDVTITGGINSGGPLTDFLWLDNCSLNGPGQDVGSITPGSSWSGRWFTDSTFQNVANGAIDANLVRGVTVQDYGGDAFSNSGLVVNCVSRRHNPLTKLGTYHPDIYQHVGTPHNIIIYGLDASDLALTQGFAFESPPIGVALVDVDVNASFYMNRAHSNFLVKDSSIQSTVGPSLAASNFVFDGVTFHYKNWTVPPPGITVR